MTNPTQTGKQKSVRMLITIAIWEGGVLALVIAAYFMTGSLVVLLGGVAASSLLFAPLILRWARTARGETQTTPTPGGQSDAR